MTEPTRPTIAPHLRLVMDTQRAQVQHRSSVVLEAVGLCRAMARFGRWRV